MNLKPAGDATSRTQRIWRPFITPLPRVVWEALSCLFVVIPLVAWALMPPRFIYDEIYYLGYTVEGLHAAPDKRRYVQEEWLVPAGPLQPALYYALTPFTGNTAFANRGINLLLFYGMVALLTGLLAGDGRTPRWQAWFASLSVLGVPTMWIITGLALTELPAMAMLVLGCWLAQKAERPSVGSPSETTAVTTHSWSLLAGGLCLGVAVCGRQPYLLVVPVLAMFLAWRRVALRDVVAFLLAGLSGTALLHVLWGGLLAPPSRYADMGLRPGHGILSVAYLGFFLFLLSPWWLLRVPWKLLASAAVVAAAANVVGPGLRRSMLESVALRVLPISPESWGLFGGTLCVAFAAMTVAALGFHCWQRRGDSWYVASCAAAVALASSAVAISHLFSSRYPLMAVPFLVAISVRHREWNILELAATLAGACLGAATLWSYCVGPALPAA